MELGAAAGRGGLVGDELGADPVRDGLLGDQARPDNHLVGDGGLRVLGAIDAGDAEAEVDQGELGRPVLGEQAVEVRPVRPDRPVGAVMGGGSVAIVTTRV
ncbi:hypothetical protein [Streptosporangium sp. KLBMP 9127]|nr:hypothetical protein [Streptosporangium sp. KLBMP 9127]